jgi:hypothetical protein
VKRVWENLLNELGKSSIPTCLIKTSLLVFKHHAIKGVWGNLDALAKKKKKRNP